MNVTNNLFLNYSRTCLEVFAMSIRQCHQYGDNKWGVTVRNHDHVRLVMGNLVVATIEEGCFWCAVDVGDTQDHQYLDKTLNWAWTTHKWSYKRPPSKSGYYWPMKNHSEIWPVIQRLHYDYLGQVDVAYPHLRKSSQKSHSDAFLADLENELRVSLPRPVY